MNIRSVSQKVAGASQSWAPEAAEIANTIRRLGAALERGYTPSILTAAPEGRRPVEGVCREGWCGEISSAPSSHLLPKTTA